MKKEKVYAKKWHFSQFVNSTLHAVFEKIEKYEKL